MQYTKYNERKENFDDNVITYIASRIFESPKDSDQVKSGLMDEAGNILNPVNDNNYSQFTDLDKFIKYLKSSLGTKRLQKFLSEYNHIIDVDPLFIMNMNSKTPINKVKDGLIKIISQVEDRTFLPEYINRKKPDFMESIDDIRTRTAFALTIINFLTYTFRNKTLPTSIDFKSNIIPSVECTFNIRGFDDYDMIKDYVITNQLADYNSINNTGIRLMANSAKIFNEYGLLNDAIKHPENYGNTYRKLAEI